ncbi:MAG: EI24 domain-containing protein [Desulfatitalea sp.]|nr:EI24 domain-containing protein [Desulfatitalea sp.]NNK02902.1 EI24 domain-containing protein [Desulfatitalea sp.]
MKSILQGIGYNIKGFKMGVRNGKLLMLGLVRLIMLVVITVAAAAIILVNYQEILNLMWNKPESVWILWLWHLVSWLLVLVLMGVSALVGFVLAQILFAVVIMDVMSQITERIITGQVHATGNMPWHLYFLNLLRQEIPRALLPVAISLLLLVLGWFTPLGPVLTIITPPVVGLFLAWDNTDLVPARRLEPFARRFAFLRSRLGFHLGFGLPLLIPIVNIALLSWAPVGATLYYLEHIDGKTVAASNAGASMTG